MKGSNIGFWKQAGFAAAGFGLAGVIWGWFAYAGEPITYPLTAAGGLSLAILGGLGLSLPSRSVKIILRVIFLGLIGAVVGFFLASLGVYNFSIWGTRIIAFFPIPVSAVDFISLEPKLGVTSYWINFVLSGALLSLFFAIGLKAKILPMVLWGAIGFGVAAIIGPIIGNLIGDVFNILLINYILTFVIICVIFSVCLTVGMRGKSEGISSAREKNTH